jgi:nicotinamide-nucleotide amidase
MMSDSVKQLVDMLLKKKLTLSLAESCTGGKIASLLTDIPGVSECFKGCAVTYSDASKESLLNVSSTTLAQFGAVSAETAEEMAKGAMKVFGTDVAASATGIAGPGGGSELKPIGTVFIAVTNGTRTECRGSILKGSREDIRNGTAKSMIRMLTDLAGELS